MGNFGIRIHRSCHDANSLGVPTMGTTNQGHVKIRCGPELSYQKDETTTQAAIRKFILFLGEAVATEFVNSIFTRGFFFFSSFGHWTLDIVFCIARIIDWDFLLWHWLAGSSVFSSRLLLGTLNSGAKYGWVVYNIIFRDFSGSAYENT